MRKSGGTSISELAASIARMGLLQNITVVAAPDQVSRLGKLRKSEIASESDLLTAGTGWLSAMFRGQDTDVSVEAEAGREVGGDANVSAETSGRADSEVHEDAHVEA